MEVCGVGVVDEGEGFEGGGIGKVGRGVVVEPDVSVVLIVCFCARRRKCALRNFQISYLFESVVDCSGQPSLRDCRRGYPYHDGIPLVSSWVAAHESNTHPLLDQDIFAISHPLGKLYLVLFEQIKVLEFPRPVRQHARERDTAVVEIRPYHGKRNEVLRDRLVAVYICRQQEAVQVIWSP